MFLKFSLYIYSCSYDPPTIVVNIYLIILLYT